MAKAAPGSESAADEAEPKRAADEAEPERTADEQKKKFRAALERKRSQQAEHNQTRNGKGGGKVQGAHGPAQGRRSFRRKSGG